jgi:hypothetical protein
LGTNKNEKAALQWDCGLFVFARIFPTCEGNPKLRALRIPTIVADLRLNRQSIPFKQGSG